MNITTRKFLGLVAVIAPALHSFTDVLEWLQGGFSPLQLWLNYLAFLPIPVIMVGLYAASSDKQSITSLTGAVLYGFAFVYFSHTVLIAIENGIPDYETLWTRLGSFYTFNGALMIAGGAMFGIPLLRMKYYPQWTVVLFLTGIGLNLVLTFLPVPDIMQTIGTLFRNTGIAGMGLYLLRNNKAVTQMK